VSVYAQVLDLGTDCGRGTLAPNKIVGGTIAKKGFLMSVLKLKF
jgi:hypothetical protein